MAEMGNAPAWYSGGNGILKTLLERSWAESKNPYVPYRGNRVEPFSPMQNKAFQLSEQEANNDHYPAYFNAAHHHIQNASASNIENKINPYIQRSIQDPTINARNYMNPYNREVTEEIGRMGSRNLLENILPNIHDKFISGGQYGSTGHQDFTNRAVRNAQEGINREQSLALQQGYNKALDTSVGQQRANLDAGNLLGGAARGDVNNQLNVASNYANLPSTIQQNKFGSINNLSNMGNQQQQLGQTRLNTAYGDFKNQQNYPYKMTSQLSNIIQNTGVPHTSYEPYVPSAPAPGGLSAGAGLLSGLYGASMQGQNRGYAKGGRVKQEHHYDEGGMVYGGTNSMPLSSMPSNDMMSMDSSGMGSMGMANQMPSNQMATNFNDPSMDPSRLAPVASKGLLSGMYGSPQQPQSYKNGGEVKHIRHYAEGGKAPTSPIHKGANDAFDTVDLHNQRKAASTNPYYAPEEFEGISDLRELAQRMKQPGPNPMGQALMKAGFAYAGRKKINKGYGDIADAFNTGLDTYNEASAANEKRYIKGVEMSALVGETHRAMANKKREHEFKELEHRENLELKRLHETNNNSYQMGQLGVARGKLGMELEEHKADMLKKNIIEGPEGMKYQYDPLTGSAKALEGMIPKQHEVKLSPRIEKVLEEANNTLEESAELKKTVNDIKALAEDLDTGPIVGELPSTVAEKLGVGKASDFEQLDMKAKGLVLKLGDSLKGSQVALGKIKILESSKMGVTRTRDTNIEFADDIKELAELSEEKADFVTQGIKAGLDPNYLNKVFGKYADDKLSYQDTNSKKVKGKTKRGEPIVRKTRQSFPQSPYDYLEAEGNEGVKKGKVSPTIGKNENQMSVDEAVAHSLGD